MKTVLGISTVALPVTNNASATVYTDLGQEENGRVEVQKNSARVRITADKPCVVIIEEGNSVRKMTLQSDSESRYFTIDSVSGNEKIIVVLRGDINSNGSINASDAALINRSLLSSTNTAYREMSEKEKIIADINGDGKVTASDVMLLSRSLLSTSHKAYCALTW